MSMYGTRRTRDAPVNWGSEYVSFFEQVGFARGLGNASLFYHPVRDAGTTVHGDDFANVADDESLDWIRGKMRERYESR